MHFQVVINIVRTPMDGSNFYCNFCGKEFTDQRVCTMHMKHCLVHTTDMKNKPKVSSSAILSSISEKGFNSISKNEYKGMEISPNLLLHQEGITNVIDTKDMIMDNKSEMNNDEKPHIMNGSTSANENQVHQLDTYSSSESYALLKQEEEFQQRMQFTHQIWSNESIGKLELLKILDDHNCPTSMYKEIMGWAHHYSMKKDCQLFSDSEHVKQRNVALKELQHRRDMKGMGPKVVKVNVGFIEENPSYIDVTVFDFKNQLLSILRNDNLMDPKNLIIDETSLLGSSTSSDICSGPDVDSITEIKDTDWYKWSNDYYNKKLGVDPNRVICGIILTVDKTHTDAKGKLCLEPVQFSLSILSTDTRKRNSAAWKCLGFINDLDTYINSKHHDEGQRNYINNGKKLPKSTLKNISYHRILSTILKSLKDVQESGLYWDLKLSSGKKHRVKFMFPICFCVVDMKGGRQLCGSYESAMCNRPSLSCSCPCDKLQDSQYKCKPVFDEEMKSCILNTKSSNSSEYHNKLKAISQHANPFNALFDMDLCEWPYGIWGLCPSEVLHQFYEGVIVYMLEEFLEKVLTPKYCRNLEKGLQNLLMAIKDQSARDMYPVGVYTLGMLRLPRTKGIEKFGCVFFLSLFLHTTIGGTEYFEGKKPMNNDMKMKLVEWRKLFETCCYYHDWLCGKSFSRKELSAKHKRIILFHQLLKKLIKRDGEGIKNIPKFHEFFHIVQNIERHGPPSGYSTLPTESIHHTVKEAAKHTSRHVHSFSHQTGKRMYERNIVKESFNFVSTFAKSLYSKRKKMTVINMNEKNGEGWMKKDKENVAKKRRGNESIHNQLYQNRLSLNRNDSEESNLKGVGLYFISWKEGENSIQCLYSVENKDSNIQNKYLCNSSTFVEYIVKQIFRCLDLPARSKLRNDSSTSNENIEDNNMISIRCFTTVVRKGFAFRGLSRDKMNFPAWALFQYEAEDGKCYAVPGKILTFVDLSNCIFQKRYECKYAKDEMHVIVESLKENPEDKVSFNRHSNICRQVEILSNRNKIPMVWCLSVNCILDVAYVIPDIGNNNLNKYLYVFPRKECLDETMLSDSIGWSNKFN